VYVCLAEAGLQVHGHDNHAPHIITMTEIQQENKEKTLLKINIGLVVRAGKKSIIAIG